jgi:hypothetical protein
MIEFIAGLFVGMIMTLIAIACTSNNKIEEG